MNHKKGYSLEVVDDSGCVADPDLPEEPKVVKSRVSDKDFVIAYTVCASYAELASSLGLSHTSVQARAAKLRKAGVPIEAYERKKKSIDVAGLTALIQKVS